MLAAALPASLQADPRLLVGAAGNEDAVVVRAPAGKALVQTVDFFTPIVNDPHSFGRIAAANALSDVYAMGGEPLCAMNIVCFPIKTMEKAVLAAILRGGMEALTEAGALLAGGHSVEDPEIKYGMAVTGVVDPDRVVVNSALAPGDVLVLTKPLGTGVLATAVKARWENAPALETLLTQWAGRLNATASRIMVAHGLKAATDVTGFGLGGHLLEMADASGMEVTLWLNRVPVLEEALALAHMGLLPAGSYANRDFCLRAVEFPASLEQGDPHTQLLVDLVFDAQTSGGLLMAVPEAKAAALTADLEAAGEFAAVVGQVEGPGEGRMRLAMAPS